MFVLVASWLTAALSTWRLSVSQFAKTDVWRATVTPLASIIGSGFLISGPVLAHEFGGGAALAMLVLLAFAYAVGAVIRFNIRHAEPLLTNGEASGALGWTAHIGQAMLCIAYAISVAYYLKLLAEFVFHGLPVGAAHTLVSRAAVTATIAVLAVVAVLGDTKRLENLARATVSVKLGVIAGMLAALALYWLLRWNAPVVIPGSRIGPNSIPLVLGLLVAVQGFETSRYLGHDYDAATRIQTMRYAQWLSSAIYLVFLVLLTPFLLQASAVQGVAGILTIMNAIAPSLAFLVLLGAASSQLSAAVADTIGAGGLVSEVSARRLGPRSGVVLSCLAAIVVVWTTDPFQVIAVASRAFALYYLLQCVIAFLAARKAGKAGVLEQSAFVALGMLCLAAAAVGAPAEQ